MNLNDEKEFNQFVTEHYNQFYRFVYYYIFNQDDTEDILQESFIKIYYNFVKFKNRSSVLTWCFRIIRNHTIDFLRKRKVEIFFDPLLRVFKASESVQPEVMTERNRVNEEIEKALNRLKPKEKEIFILKHFQDLSIKEISKITGFKQNNVKVKLFRAAHKLKNLLKNSNLF